MAASRNGEASADAHLRFAGVQGILANVEEQARNAGQDFRRATGIRTGNQDDLFGPGDYSADGDHSPADGKDAGPTDSREYFCPAENEPHDVPAGKKPVAEDCTDGSGQ